LSPTIKGRLPKILKKQYILGDNDTMTLETIINNGLIVNKKILSGETAFNRLYHHKLDMSKQIEYEKRLKAKKIYILYFKNNSYIEVPKVVYDCLIKIK